eukprot:9108825-Pyramimonas_sp.AAC.1
MSEVQFIEDQFVADGQGSQARPSASKRSACEPERPWSGPTSIPWGPARAGALPERPDKHS